MFKRLIVCVAAILASAWALSSPALAADPAAQTPNQAEDASRIVPDPAVRRGVLANGMRYAIMQNSTGSGALSLRLAFAVGSFDEEYNERGSAHFLEHMAFSNGKRWDLSGDERAFAALGVAFGRDQNAATSRFDTVFTLDLPKADGPATDLALNWLRSVASKTVFPDDEVEHERRIILQELAERSTSTTAISDQLNAFIAPGLDSEQDEIGASPEAVKAITPAILETFYRRWYRPENAVLVIVGDVSPDQLERQVRQVFGDWTNPTVQPPRHPLIEPDVHRPEDALVIADAHAPTVEEVCRVTAAASDRSDTVPTVRRKMMSQLWVDILNDRFAEMAGLNDPPFLKAVASKSEGREASRTCIDINVFQENWSGALAAIHAAIDQMSTAGPTVEEVDRAVDYRRAKARGELHTAGSRNSANLAAAIADDALNEGVFAAPYEAFRVFDAAVVDVTPAQVKAAFNQDWSGAGPMLALVSPAPPTIDALRLAWDKPQATAAPQAAPAKLNDWAYADFGPPGKVVKREVHQSPDFVQITYANGLVLTFKQTSFQANDIRIRIRIGAGRHELGASDLVKAQMGAAFLLVGGLGRNDLVDIQRHFANSTVSADLSVDTNTFSLSGQTNDRGLLGQLQLLTAFVTDPGFRSDMDDRLANGIELLYRQLRANPGAVFSDTLNSAVAPGGPLTLPAKEVLLHWKMKDYGQVLRPVLTQAPLAVTIVGDVDEATVTEMVGKTLGALPPRPNTVRDRPDAFFIRFPAGELPAARATHEGPQAKAVVGAVWPLYVAEPARRREEIALNIVERVLEDALRHRLREELGLTYGPGVEMSSPDFGDQATFEAVVQTSPADAERVVGEIQMTARRLAQGQVSDADIEAARKPLVAAMTANLSTNAYWVGELSGAPDLQDDIDEIIQVPVLLAAVTPDEVRKAAATWLARKPLVVVVTPAAGPAQAATP